MSTTNTVMFCKKYILTTKQFALIDQNMKTSNIFTCDIAVGLRYVNQSFKYVEKKLISLKLIAIFRQNSNLNDN